MRPLRLAFLALLCALIALPCLAQGVDPLAVVCNGGSPSMSLSDARAALVAQGDAAVNRLVEKLKAAGTPLLARINIGATLAEIAKTRASAELKEGLLLCTREESPAVRYWGLRGLSWMQGVEAAEIAKVVDAYLDPKQPDPLKLLGADVSARLKVKASVPKLIALLRAIQPKYMEERQNVAVDVFLKQAGGEPGVTRARPRTPIDIAPTIGPEGMAPGIEPADGAAATGGTEAERVPERPRVDLPAVLAKAEPAQEKELAEKLEALDEVAMIRRIGNAVERITADMLTTEQAEARQNDHKWNFLKQPPWKLEESILIWVGWYEQNRNKFAG